MDAKKLLKQLDAIVGQIQVMRTELLAEAATEAPNIATEEAARICHYCKQPLADERVLRGCHERCYKQMLRAINAGEITEAALMQAGKLAMQKTSGRKRASNPARELAAQALTGKARAVAKKEKGK